MTALPLWRPVPVLLLTLTACAPPARTSEVFLPSDSLSIAGTLYLPAYAGRHPAVILVHGSGLVLGG